MGYTAGSCAGLKFLSLYPIAKYHRTIITHLENRPRCVQQEYLCAIWAHNSSHQESYTTSKFRRQLASSTVRSANMVYGDAPHRSHCWGVRIRISSQPFRESYEGMMNFLSAFDVGSRCWRRIAGHRILCACPLQSGGCRPVQLSPFGHSPFTNHA